MRSYGATSPEDIDASLLGHEAALANSPLGVASIVVVDPTASYTSEETRKAATEATRKAKDQVRSHVLILLGDGFWASAIRGVMTTFAVMSGASYPKTVVRTEEEGVKWTIETIGEAPRYEPALLAALAQLRPRS